MYCQTNFQSTSLDLRICATVLKCICRYNCFKSFKESMRQFAKIQSHNDATFLHMHHELQKNFKQMYPKTKQQSKNPDLGAFCHVGTVFHGHCIPGRATAHYATGQWFHEFSPFARPIQRKFHFPHLCANTQQNHTKNWHLRFPNRKFPE